MRADLGHKPLRCCGANLLPHSENKEKRENPRKSADRPEGSCLRLAPLQAVAQKSIENQKQNQNKPKDCRPRCRPTPWGPTLSTPSHTPRIPVLVPLRRWSPSLGASTSPAATLEAWGMALGPRKGGRQGAPGRGSPPAVGPERGVRRWAPEGAAAGSQGQQPARRGGGGGGGGGAQHH